MTGSFLDTSALAKHYHGEVGSAEVDRLWADAGQALFISRIGALIFLIDRVRFSLRRC
jgi:hypothetical protein